MGLSTKMVHTGIFYPGGRLNIKTSSYQYRDPHVNTLRARQNVRHFADDTYKSIFLNDNIRILIKVSLKPVTTGPFIIIPALVQIMAWRQPGEKPLSETMMVRLPMHIFITLPQWAKDKMVARWLSYLSNSKFYVEQSKQKWDLN